MCETTKRYDYISIRSVLLLRITKLNGVYVSYIKGETDFTALYEKTRTLRNINRSIVVTYRGFDESDAMELFDDVMLSLINGDVVPDFEQALNVRLKRRRIDLLRKTKRRLYEKSLNEIVDAAEDEGAATPGILRSEFDTEYEVFRKKEADHRQVIDSLIQDGNPDATTTAIVEAMLHAPPSATRNEIAKSIGIHHEVVKRKLTALSRKYDVNRFGDYRDYLAV